MTKNKPKFCVLCKKSIPQARIKALPETRVCVRCSEAIGGEVEMIVIEENLGSSVVNKPMIHKRVRPIEPI